jgi:4-hydroxy-tetrahydrodipicolinate synthase
MSRTAAETRSIHGVWTALVTPFRQDLEIDWDAFERLLLLQEAAGIDGVVVCGTTGESPTLAVQEKLALIRKARALLSPKVRVMAGTGDNDTRHSVELSRLAQDAGADCLLIVTPPYNKPSTAGLINHYRTIAESVTIPLCLYHVPGRTAQLLTVDQLAAIVAVKGVTAIKEASGDLALFSRTTQRASGTAVLSGDDPTYLASLAVGGRGIISVVSNLYPVEMVALTNAFAAQDTARALALHDALMPAIDAMFCEVNPCPLKAALAIRGHAGNYVRAPLAPVTDVQYRLIQDTLGASDATLKAVMG